MKILRAEIQGFRSFSSAQVIDFSCMKPGLYHITGRNLVEPELDANGAGKSSLFESMFWALYGKTSRNLKAGTVKNWNSDEKCGVVLDVKATSGEFSILRMWKPNTLEIAGDAGNRPVNQPELEHLIGLPPEGFLFSTYFAQFTPAFADLAAAEQTALFATVLNLGLWEQASSEAKSRADKTEGEIQRLKEATARIQGQAEELLAQDYVTAEKVWEKAHKGGLQTAEIEAAKKKQVLDSVITEDNLHDVVRGKIKEQSDLVSTLNAEYRQLSATVTELSRKNITKCPMCGQAVDSKHIKKELDKTTALVMQKEAELRNENKKLNQLRKKIPEDHEKQRQAADGEFQFARAALLELKRKTNPYTALREVQEARGEELAQQLEKAEEALDTAEKGIKSVQYWIKGFKEIRLSLIHESLTQLTVEVNETLFQLGLQDWGVEFDIERENRGGGINRSFTIMVHAPHVKEPVPWAVWSGGEAQRLRLAISMGFSNLICNRTGATPNVEFWDEPTTWLSDSGLQDLLTVLAERAERQQKVILLADHRALDFGGFSGVLCVTKDKDGSHLTV